jgi:glutamate-1-semialdehyde 2,1-aminomutase
MELVAPAGPMYQAGTLSGNPLAVAAGLTTLKILQRPDFYEDLEQRSAAVEGALVSAAGEAGCPIVVNRVGSMFCPYFSETPVTTFAEVLATDRDRHRRFFHSLLESGVMPAPSPFEAWFCSAAHGEEEIERTRIAARKAFEAALAG